MRTRQRLADGATILPVLKKLAANLLAFGGVSPLHQITPPPRRRSFNPAEDFYTRQTAIRREQEANDRWRIMLATAVMCTGVFVAGVALWQARTARTVYIPIPSEPTAPAMVTISAPAVYRAPVAVEGTVGNASISSTRLAASAPAMPSTWTPPPAAMPTPVDYAARDRRMGVLDEDVRIVREHPTDSRYYWHYYSSSARGVDQARRDAYLKELDQQRNDLRREKWALEGR